MSANRAGSPERTAAMNVASSAASGLASVMVVNPSTGVRGLPELTTWRRISDRCPRLPGEPVGQGAALAEQVAQSLERLGYEAVPAPGAAALACEQAGRDEDPQVVAQRRLGHVEVLGEVAEARFAAGGVPDQGHEPDPDRVGQGLEQLRGRLGLGVRDDGGGLGQQESHRLRPDVTVVRGHDSSSTAGCSRSYLSWIDKSRSKRLQLHRRTSIQPVRSALEGPFMSRTPEVLFVCVHNAGRSQMAAALLQHYALGRIAVRSAGSEPADKVNFAAAEALAEWGLDITAEVPAKLSTKDVEASDVVITTGCGDTCPIFPGKRYLDWPLDDPAGQGVDAVRPIRDEIDRRVRGLVAELLDNSPGGPVRDSDR